MESSPKFPPVPEEVLAELPDDEIKQAVRTDQSVIPSELIEEAGGVSDGAISEIKRLAVPQRIRLAIFGNRSVRSSLIRDSSRLVQLAVLGNPRLSEEEVAEFSKNTQVDDTVLRKIAASANWMRVYAVKCALVSNPKTPVDISLNLLKLLQHKDLQRVSKSKNIPQVLATHATKLIEKRR